MKSFHEGMHLVNNISKVPWRISCGLVTVGLVGCRIRPRRLTEADRDYVDRLGGREQKLFQRSTRFGRGGASYSLRQMFVLCLPCALDFIEVFHHAALASFSLLR